MKNKKIQQTFEHQTSKGFTLVEVLMAMFILSVGLLGIAALTVGIAQSNRVSRDLTVATTLVQDKLEDLRKTSYLNVASEAKSALASPYSDFRRGVSVAVDTPEAGMKTVTVNVSWDSDNHEVELKTILVQ